MSADAVTPEAVEPGAALDAATRAKMAPYEAFEARLTGALGDYRRRNPLYMKAFAGLVAAGLACFIIGPLAGVWATFSATMVAVGGYFMLRARVWELEIELGLVRDELARLRGETVAKRQRPML